MKCNGNLVFLIEHMILFIKQSLIDLLCGITQRSTFSGMEPFGKGFNLYQFYICIFHFDFGMRCLARGIGLLLLRNLEMCLGERECFL